MRIRVATLAALMAVCGSVLPGHAAPKPQIVDAAGDQMGMDASYDIRSALFTTAGTTVRSGRRSVYVPTRLVVTIGYGGDVASELYRALVVSFATDDCRVYLEAYGDARTYGSASCLDTSFTFPAKANGATLTFSLPLSVLGKHLAPGTELTALATWTNVGEPAQGYEAGDLVGTAFTVDFASSGLTYTIR
jgi:hypothetical protein